MSPLHETLAELVSIHSVTGNEGRLCTAIAKRMLPIWIGVCEANSIALELEGVESPRPMTHDLIRNLINTTGCAVEHIFIHSLEDSIFKASMA